MQTISQRLYAAKELRREYAAVCEYATSKDMRVTRDDVSGYWLHCGGIMRFVDLLDDVWGWITYLDTTSD